MPGRQSQRRLCSVMSAAQLQQQTIEVRSEANVDGMTPFLDSLKWDANGLVAAIVQVQLLKLLSFFHMASETWYLLSKHCRTRTC